jgi:hypothetical protein
MGKIKLLAIVFILLFTMCKATKDKSVTTMNSEPINQTKKNEELIGGKPQQIAPAVVYKTRADYRKFVPITLNSDRSAIQSYPASSDIYYDGQLAVPTELINGYLLDNRGITAQTAFLNITYEEYSQLKEVNLDFLWKRIQDATPLIELYHCGYRNSFTNEVEELNQIIQKGFKGCKKLTLPPSAVFIYIQEE